VGRTPGASAAAIFPAAAGANRGIFFRGGRPATVAEVYANLTSGTGGAGVVAPPTTEAPDQGFVEYASAGRLEHLREEQNMVDLVLRGPQGGDDIGFGGGAVDSMFSAEMLQALSEARDRSSA